MIDGSWLVPPADEPSNVTRSRHGIAPVDSQLSVVHLCDDGKSRFERSIYLRARGRLPGHAI